MGNNDSDGSEGQSPDEDKRSDADTPPGIAFASADDATRYRALVARSRALEAEHTAIQGEQAAILRRAHWSLDGVLERDG